MADHDELVAAIDQALGPLGFLPRPAPALVHTCLGAWTLKTWLVNRGVIVIDAPDPAQAAQRVKLEAGEQLGRVPFFYGMGLQVVVLGPLIPQGQLEQAVDKIDNQRCIVQAIWVVDLDAGEMVSHRTWGQVVSAKYQDAIEGAIQSFLRG